MLVRSVSHLGFNSPGVRLPTAYGYIAKDGREFEQG